MDRDRVRTEIWRTESRRVDKEPSYSFIHSF